MGDLMALAFRLDLTRVCTFMWANGGRTGRSRRSMSGRAITCRTMRATPPRSTPSGGSIDGGANDSRISYRRSRRPRPGRIVRSWTTRCSASAALSDGNRHNHHDLPIIVAGKGGGVASGKVVRHASRTPLCNLFVSMGRAAGVPLETFGDSTGVARL